MNDNIFIDRFNKKSNSELEAISLNEAVYTDEARITALNILKLRDYTTAEIENAYHTILTRLKREKAEAAVEETESNTETTEIPELHSKRLIMMFSIFFSTLFGGALLMYNLKKMNKPKARTHVLVFCIAFAFLPVFLMTYFNFSPDYSIFLNLLGGVILTEYFWNKHLGHGLVYTKRNWVKPTLIALVISIPLVLLVLYSSGISV